MSIVSVPIRRPALFSCQPAGFGVAIGLLALLLTSGCQRDTPRPEILFAASTDPLSSDSVIDLFAIREDGSGLRQLTQGPRGVRSFPTWSRDGRHIAYVSASADSGAAIRVMDPDGTHDRQVARLDSAQAAFLDWSPDGHRILFIAGRSLAPTAATAVYLVNQDGSDLRVVLSDSAHYSCPAWLPETDAFLVSAYAAGTSRILRARIAAWPPEVLFVSDSLWLSCPAPSPDGSLVLLNGAPTPPVVPSPKTGTFQVNIYVMNGDGTGLSPLTSGPVITNYGRWSRDQSYIVMQSNRHMTRAPDPRAALDSLELYVMRRDGAALTRITNNRHFDSHPSW